LKAVKFGMEGENLKKSSKTNVGVGVERDADPHGASSIPQVLTLAHGTPPYGEGVLNPA
jgi:hypothetical protein